MTTTSLGTVVSDLESIGAAVTSITTPVGGIATAVTAVANATNNILAPIIQDAENQKYEKQFQNRLKEINAALSESDGDSRASLLANVASELCIAGGYPATGGMGEDISVPLAYLNALLVIAAAQERSTAYLAAVIRKA